MTALTDTDDISEREHGTLRHYREDRDFGFIRPDRPGSPDLFVHRSTFEAIGIRFPTTGMRLSYATEPDRRDPSRFRAVALRVIG
jgi:cold shock CspA family protein